MRRGVLFPRIALRGPVKLLVDLACAEQMFQLLEASESAEVKHVRLHVDTFEKLAQLPRTFARVPVT